MSLSDCEKCWDTPCTCGFEYILRSSKYIKDQIKMLQKVLLLKEKFPTETQAQIYARMNRKGK